MWREGRLGLTLGVLSAACWLGSFAGWTYIGGIAGLSMTLVGILVGIFLSPVAFAVSIRGLWKAARGGDEPIWPPLTGLILSFPPAAFVALIFVASLISG